MAEDHRLQKLIPAGLGGISRGNCFTRGIGAFLSSSEHNGIPGEFVAFPAAVTIHREITTDHCRNRRPGRLQILCELRQISRPALWRSIAAIRDRMHQHFPASRRLGGSTNGHQMILMTVHSPIADQTQQVQPMPLGLGESLLQYRITRQGILTDGLVDARQVLINNPPRAQIEVPHFTVAHLPGWQTHVLPRAGNFAPRIFLIHHIMKWSFGQQRGIPIFNGPGETVRVDSPTIANDQNYWLLWHRPRRCRGGNRTQARRWNPGDVRDEI